MLYCIIVVLIAAVLLISIILIRARHKSPTITQSTDSSTDALLGGAKRSNKRSNNGRGKRSKAKNASIKNNSYPKRKAQLTNVHHNENAEYIFIYFGDLYPSGLKESSMFKSVMSQTTYKDQAYAVYERPLNGQWFDCLVIDDAWYDFKARILKEFHVELTNRAQIVLIGKGFGAFYAKLFMYKFGETDIAYRRSIALNGMHLRELIPSMIMEKTGLPEINIYDIEYYNDRCMFQGKDYIKILGLNIYIYTLMLVCDRIIGNDYYSFYIADGTDTVELVPFNIVYERTYLAKYKDSSRIIDWLKRPKLLEAVIKEVI